MPFSKSYMLLSVVLSGEVMLHTKRTLASQLLCLMSVVSINLCGCKMLIEIWQAEVIEDLLCFSYFFIAMRCDKMRCDELFSREITDWWRS